MQKLLKTVASKPGFSGISQLAKNFLPSRTFSLGKDLITPKFSNLKKSSPVTFGKRSLSAYTSAKSSSVELPSYLLNTSPFQVTTLPNEFRVASEYIPGETATLTLYIDVGSKNENEKNNGAAHFLEHLNFKGTQKRARSQMELEIENLGASLNAYTSREHQVFTTKIVKNDVAKALDILQDIVLNSNLSNEAIESERGTILREAEEVQKDLQEVVFDYLHSAAYQGHALGRTILGSEENIKTLSREELLKFRADNYVANRMVLVGAGAVKHEDLVSAAKQIFGSLPSKPSSASSSTKTGFTGSLVTVRDDAQEEAHIVIAAEGVSTTHPDFLTFQLIQTITGNWDRTIGGGKNLGSRLCEVVATEELCHSLNSFQSNYADTGLFGYYFTTDNDPDHIEDTTWEVLNEWSRIANVVRDSEVERAKQKMKSAMLMNLDGNSAISEDIGRQLVSYGRRITPAELSLRIDAITSADVRRVATEKLQDVDLAIVAMGPVANFPDYNRVRSWTYWNRW